MPRNVPEGETNDVCIIVFDTDTNVATGDGILGFSVPPAMNGLSLVDVVGAVKTKGVTGATDIQIRRERASVSADMLSTKVTIGDEWFARDGVVSPANADIITGDLIFVDVDAVHSGTAAKGLSVTMSFGS